MPQTSIPFASGSRLRSRAGSARPVSYTHLDVYKRQALTLPQRQALFAETVFGDPDASLESPVRQALQKLAGATPGDFATVKRQERLLGERYTAENFLLCLERECALKKGGKSMSIGFLG